MKNLTQHIKERLKINKDYKSGDFDWLKAEKLISMRFARGHYPELRIFIRNINNIEKLGDEDEYVIDSISSFLGATHTRFTFNAKANILYTHSDWCLSILIHPEDYERLKELYGSIDYLDEGTKYSKYDILDQLHIDSSFARNVHDSVYKFVNHNDNKNKIKKELKQLLK